MKRLFVETSGFTSALAKIESGIAILSHIQKLLLENPQNGDVVPGSGGIRKIRVPDPTRNKGTRGGLRVLFIDLADREVTFLLTIYGKGDKDDLSPVDKKILRQLVDILKSTPIRGARSKK
jgi:hypothetical protein